MTMRFICARLEYATTPRTSGARKARSDDRDEHEQRPDHRVDDELHRRTEPPWPAPDADEDVERDQHGLPEDVEEDEVLGREDADRGAFEEEQEAQVDAGPLAPDPEPVADRRRRDNDGEADEPEREVVETDLVGDVEVREPHLFRAGLRGAHREVEVERRSHPEGELGERDEKGEPARGP